MATAIIHQSRSKAAIAASLDCVVEQANSTLECGGNRFDAIGQRLSQCHAETEAALCDRIRLARTQGQLSDSEDVHGLAQLFTATMLGMGVMARTNPDPVMIRQLAKTALRVLPNASE